MAFDPYRAILLRMGETADVRAALSAALANRDVLDIGASGFEHYHSGTYDELFVARDAKPLPMLARVRVRSDEGSGAGLLHQHRLMNRLPPLLGPRPLYIECDPSAVGFPFRIEEFFEGKPVCAALKNKAKIEAIARLFARLHDHVRARPSIRARSRPEDKCVLTAMLPLLAPNPHRDIRVERIAALAEQALESPLVTEADAWMSMIHGDVHYGNLLEHARGLSLVDWEHIAIGDPAIDVATLFWFSALMGLDDAPLSAPLQERFFDVYIEATNDTTLVERTRVYEPIVVALQLAGWSEQLHRLDTDFTKDDGRIRRAEEIRTSLARAMVIVERARAKWFAS